MTVKMSGNSKTSYLCNECNHVMTKVAVECKEKHEEGRDRRTGCLISARQERTLLQNLAQEHGTPIFVIDHEKIRENYREFREHLPNVQVYFAVKANSNPEIVKTLFEMGSSFDVASMPEFMIVYENIKNMPEKERQDWIWDKIIYANTIKPIETLEALDKYKPLVTFDNIEELKKIKAACTPCRPRARGSGSRIPVRWSNSPPSSAHTRAKQWT